MQKRILFISLGVATTALFIFGAYYVAVFLPQKQKAEMELTKLELEAKIEQEKTEQAMNKKNLIFSWCGTFSRVCFFGGLLFLTLFAIKTGTSFLA